MNLPLPWRLIEEYDYRDHGYVLTDVGYAYRYNNNGDWIMTDFHWTDLLNLIGNELTTHKPPKFFMEVPELPKEFNDYHADLKKLSADYQKQKSTKEK